MNFKRFYLGAGLIISSLLMLGLTACGGDTATQQPTPGTTSAITILPFTPTLAAAINPTVNSTPTNTASPQVTPLTSNGGITMKAAFAIVEPVVKSWKSDAVYVSIFNPEDDPIGMDGGGHALQWYFEAVSPANFQHSFWLVKSDNSGKAAASKTTEDTLDASRGPDTVNRKLPLISSLIDTDQLMQVAQQNGGTTSDQPIGIHLEQPANAGDPLAFDLVFYNGENVLRLRIDAQTGKLVDNTKG